MKHLLSLVGIWLLLAAGPLGAEPGKSVLIVQSYHKELAWTGQCEQGIIAALGPGYQVTTFYMNTKRLPESMFRERADTAWQAFLDIKPDLLMIGDDNGLQLLAPQLKTVNTPVVYFGINHNPRTYFPGPLPSHITGVLERVPLFPWFRYLRQIMPGAGKALVLMDESPTSHAIVQRTFQGQRQIKIVGITAVYRLAEDWNNWKDLVVQGRFDMIVIPTFHAVKQGDGRSVDYRKVITWTSANARVPVFSLQDYVVGPEGAVGSYVIYGRNHGFLAGEMARKILEGEKSPRQLPPQTDQEGRFFFNRSQLNRFSLTLPSDIEAQAVFQ